MDTAAASIPPINCMINPVSPSGGRVFLFDTAAGSIPPINCVINPVSSSGGQGFFGMKTAVLPSMPLNSGTVPLIKALILLRRRFPLPPLAVLNPLLCIGFRFSSAAASPHLLRKKHTPFPPISTIFSHPAFSVLPNCQNSVILLPTTEYLIKSG